MTAESSALEGEHKVLQFRPRAGSRRGGRGEPRPQAAEPVAPPPVRNFACYEGNTGEDDYRHRMMVNIAALAATIALAAAGAWLTIQIADLRKN